MLPHPIGNNFDGAFRGEDDHENHLDTFKVGVQLVTVSVEVGSVQSQRNAGSQDSDENKEEDSEEDEEEDSEENEKEDIEEDD